MSTPLRFVELFDRPVETKAGVRSLSKPDVELTLKRSAPITRPVDIAKLLKSFGLGLTDAHQALNRIVADDLVTLSLCNADRATMIFRLAELGVAAV